MKTKIYVLCQPGGAIRYIGKTIRPLALRFRAHLYRSRCGEKSHLFNWIRSILSTGRLPTISLIGEVEGNGSSEEVAWIKYFRDEGIDLVNSTDGGEGALGYVHTEETRRRLSKMLRGRPGWNKGKHLSEATRKKLSEFRGEKHWAYGKHLSMEARQKISEANKGKVRSEETCKKIGDAHRGKHHSEEHCRKIGKANIGKRLGYHASIETRRKSSESHKGKPNGCLGTHRSAESKLKMSLAKKGKPWTEEHRRTMREVVERKRELKQNEAQA